MAGPWIDDDIDRLFGRAWTAGQIAYLPGKHNQADHGRKGGKKSGHPSGKPSTEDPNGVARPTTTNDEVADSLSSAKPSNLSDDEKNAVFDYTDFAYEEWNGSLRAGKQPGKGGKAFADEGPAVLVGALHRHELAGETVVTRGMSPLPGHTWEVGQAFVDKGFVSTSLQHDLAFEGSTLMRITLPKGTKGMDVSEHSSVKKEREFLMPPGASFRVTKVGVAGKQQIVEVELVGQASMAEAMAAVNGKAV